MENNFSRRLLLRAGCVLNFPLLILGKRELTEFTKLELFALQTLLFDGYRVIIKKK